MNSGKRFPRLAVRLICFAAASAVLWPLLPWKNAPGFILRLSPFTAICSVVALRSIGLSAGIGLIFAAVALIKRRWFCRYACPTGLLLEGIANVGIRKTSWWKRCPPLGRYFALLTLAGAAVGYPLLLWMDPLSIFSSSFGIRGAANPISAAMAGLGLGILIVLSLTSGSIWCSRLCPLGGAQELLACAGSALKIGQRSEPPQSREASGASIGFLARRAFLIGAAGTGMGLVAQKIGAARGDQAPLRPPGAVEEQGFAGLCIRCGNCIRACPSKIIHSDVGQAGLAGFLAPVIQYEKKYCLEDCRACTQVCPSGALTELDLEQKRRYVIGEALVDGTICWVPLGRKDCDACVRSCPFDAVQMHWDEGKYIAYPLVDTGKCNGCGACEVVCPTGDIKAIRVWKRID
jgi:ferredoxin